MRTAHIVVSVALSLTISGLARAHEPGSEARTAAWFEANRGRPPLVRMFLQRMPKGGDIHTHLTGAVYAESYLDWAAAAGLCASPATGAIVAAPCTGDARPVTEAFRD